MKKKGKKKKKAASTAVVDDDPVAAEQREAAIFDELLALQSIYGDEDFVLQHDQAPQNDEGGAFALQVRPSPGEAETNYVAASLEIRYPRHYPDEELKLKVTPALSLAAQDAHAIAKALHAAAAHHAELGEVCAFQIIQLCQEMLQELNVPPPVDSNASPDAQGGGDGGEAAPRSLWEQMQLRRSANEPPPASPSGGGFGGSAYGIGVPGYEALFGDDAAAVPWQQHASPHQDRPRSGAGGGEGERGANGGGGRTPPVTAKRLPRRAAGTIVSPRKLQGQQQQQQEKEKEKEKEKASLKSNLAPPPQTTAVNTSTTAAVSQHREEGVDGESSGTERSFSQRLRSISALGKSVLPMALRRYLEPSGTTGSDASSPRSSAGGAGSGAGPRLRRPSGLGAPPRVPRPPSASTSLPLVSSSDIMGVSGGPSRFVSDFSEVKQLGRGAYGVVVLAINRFDGRSYAVKRVTLNQHSASSTARIMREVATLSRLNHANVVRYYQAWLEDLPASGKVGDEASGGSGEDDEGDADSELMAWGVGGGGDSGSESDVDDDGDEYEDGGGDGRLRKASSGGGESVSFSQRQGTKDEYSSSEGDSMERLYGAPSRPPPLAVEPSFTFDRSRPPAPTATATRSQSVLTSSVSAQSDMGAGRRPRRAAAAFAAPRRTKRVLYIVMEYCRSTLRDLLDAGPLEEAVRWKLLRQLLSGLAHIHAQGIWHRDLKPANLFLDDSADIKLGDFGLANGALDESDATGVCGTSFYIAPEIAAGSNEYDERVDVYSAGIIAFELWCPFATAMERVALLRALRERGEFPPGMAAEHPAATELIAAMLQRDPGARPAARQALRSPLIPPAVGAEQLTDLLRSLPDDPAAKDRILTTLFTPQERGGSAAGGSVGGASAGPAAAPTTATAARGPPAGYPSPAAQHYERVLAAVRAGFARHGAVPMASVAVGPTAPDDPVAAERVLSRSGERLTLRHELRTAFAAWAAGLVAEGAPLLDGFRRYEIATVWRAAQPSSAGPHVPRAHLQADYDVVVAAAAAGGAGPRDPPLAEIDALSAVCDVLGELPELAQRWEVRIGHRGLFEAALAHAAVPREVRAPALAVLRQLAGASPLHPVARSARWPAARDALLGLGLRRDAADRLGRLAIEAAGEAPGALRRLAQLLAPGAAAERDPPPPWLAALRAAVPLAAAWGVPPQRTIIDPILSPLADGFVGVLFEVHLVNGETGATAVAAVGGRCDGLMKAAWAAHWAAHAAAGPPPAAPLGGAGATLNIERLVAATNGSGGGGGSALGRLSSADVLVCSRGAGKAGARLTGRTEARLAGRMRMVKALWDAGIKAEMMTALAPSLTDQFAYASSRNIPWMVIVDSDEVESTAAVRVKHLHGKLEEDVAMDEVARYMVAQLQPRGYYVGGGGALGSADVETDAEGVGGERERRRRDKR